jgi:hypothetical protein
VSFLRTFRDFVAGLAWKGSDPGAVAGPFAETEEGLGDWVGFCCSVLERLDGRLRKVRYYPTGAMLLYLHFRNFVFRAFVFRAFVAGASALV